MENTDLATEGPEFNEGLGMAGFSVAALSNLLPQLRAGAADDALWEQARTLLENTALGLEEMARAIVDNTNLIERLIDQLKLRG